MDYRLIVVLGLLAGCVACSDRKEQSAPATAMPAAASSAPTLAVSSSAAAPGGLTYLYDLMQRPDFSTAFAALSGAEQLPPWASQGGVETPAQQVVIEGHTQLLAEACKPHDCPAERILILYDENTHAMSGLFARRKASVSNHADSNEPANDDFIWLGAPDDASKQLLQQKLYLPN